MAQLPGPLNGVRVAQYVGVDPLFYASFSGCLLYNLPDSLPVYVEEPITLGQPLPEGVGLEPALARASCLRVRVWLWVETRVWPI